MNDLWHRYVIFKKFCLPQFEKTAQDPGDLTQLVASIFTSTVGLISLVSKSSSVRTQSLNYTPMPYYSMP